MDVVGLEQYIEQEKLAVLIKPITLKSFKREAMSAIYTQSLQQYYKLKSTCQAHKIELYEDDIRPVDRYLMERYVKGGVKFAGIPIQKQGYLHYTQAKLTHDDVEPQPMSILSIDIECNEMK